MYICLPCAVCCERDAVPPAENGLPNPGKTKGRKIKKQVQEIPEPVLLGDPYENRTRVTAVKGPCLNRLTNGPWSTQRGLRALAECCHVFSDAWLVAVTGFEPVTLRV